MRVTVLLLVLLAPLSVAPGSTPVADPDGSPLAEYHHRLPNGLQTLVVPLPGASLTCASLVVPVGRAHELEGEEGAALGAARLAVAAAEVREAPRIEARVGRMRTTFVLCGPPGEAPVLAERLSKVTGPVDSEVALVQPGVVPVMERALDPLYAALFPDHPIGRPAHAAGQTSLSRAVAEAFRGSRYTPLGSFLVIAGEVGDPFAAAVESGRPFAPWPVRVAADLPPLPPAPASLTPSGTVASPGLGMGGPRTVVVGGRLENHESPERVAATVLLVEMARLRLSREVPQEDLLSGYPLREGGVWALGLRCREEETRTRLSLVVQLLDELAAGEVDAGALEKIRNDLLVGRTRSGGPAGGDVLPHPEIVLGQIGVSLGTGSAPGAGMIELTAALSALGPEEVAEEASRVLAADRRVVVQAPAGNE